MADLKSRDDRTKAWQRVAVMAVSIVVGLLVLVIIHASSLSEAANLAEIFAFLLAYAAAVVSLYQWMATRAKPGIALEETLARLRRMVWTQWTAETGAWELHQPRPLRLRWRETDREVQVGATSSTPLHGRLLQDPNNPRPPAAALAEVFAVHPARQLVILGEPGAGKTTLAVLYTLAVLDSPQPADHVPVVLSIAGWNPAVPVRDWLADRLRQDYPQVFGRAGEAYALVDDRRVVPVLDGLDEMPAARRDEALRQVDAAGGTGLRMVLTCRSTEFEQAVVRAGVLSRAAVIEIEPVRVADAAVYLTQREAVGSRRWQTVLDTMRNTPEGPLATALSTPLMISLCRRAYRAPAGEPARLTSFGSRAEIEHHLLERFLPSAYTDSRDAARAERWLAFLAHHLRDRVRDPDLEWWRLAQAMPWPAITALVTLIVTSLATVVAPPLMVLQTAKGIVGPDDTDRYSVNAILIMAAIGGVMGIHAAQVSHKPASEFRDQTVLAAMRGALRDFRAIVSATAVLSVVVGLVLLTMSATARPIGTILNNYLYGLVVGPAAIGGLILAVALSGGLLVAVNALDTGRGAAVRRSAPRLRELPSSLSFGLRVSLLFGLPVIIVATLHGEFSALQIALIISATVASPIGIGRWLSTPANENISTSPLQLLRGDRRATLLTGGAVGTAIALLATLFAWSQGGAGPVEAWVFGVLLGAAGAVLVALGSGGPWVAFTMARCWLAAAKKLPWRLTRFLRQAHQTGILRQTGPTYQFRHYVLRDHLADKWPQYARIAAVSEKSDRSPSLRSRRRRLITLSATLTALAVLPVMSVGIEMSVRPARTFDVDPPTGDVILNNRGDVIVLHTTTFPQVLGPDPAGTCHPLARGRSPDGDILVVNCRDDTELLTTATRRRLAVLPYRYRSVAAAFTEDGKTLITATTSGTIAQWNVAELTD